MDSTKFSYSPNAILFPTLFESGFQQLVAPGRRVGKKFAVPGGNEAVTNEISRRREAGERRKGGALNGI